MAPFKVALVKFLGYFSATLSRSPKCHRDLSRGLAALPVCSTLRLLPYRLLLPPKPEVTKT